MPTQRHVYSVAIPAGDYNCSESLAKFMNTNLSNSERVTAVVFDAHHSKWFIFTDDLGLGKPHQ